MCNTANSAEIVRRAYEVRNWFEGKFADNAADTDSSVALRKYR